MAQQKAAAKIGTLWVLKSCILAQFRPENIFRVKIKKKMLLITKHYYMELLKYSPSNWSWRNRAISR